MPHFGIQAGVIGNCVITSRAELEGEAVNSVARPGVDNSRLAPMVRQEGQQLTPGVVLVA